MVMSVFNSFVNGIIFLFVMGKEILKSKEISNYLFEWLKKHVRLSNPCKHKSNLLILVWIGEKIF